MIAAVALVIVVLAIVAQTASAKPARVTTAAPACVASEKPLSKNYDAATKKDRVFNRNFRHCFTTIHGVQMHYVIGGHGPKTTVLLHGWPESWYEFNGIMPDLLPGRTVIAVDLPGMGDTTGRLPDYKKTTMARYVHLLLDRLDRQHDVQLVGHDFGFGVSYALAAQYRQQVAGLFLIDFPLVGKNLKWKDIEPLRWHFPFNRQEPLAEKLVSGREQLFFSYFYPTQSHVKQPVPRRSVAEYVRVYSRPQVLHAGFELYRTWEQDEVDNQRLEATPLDIPVHVLAADGLLDLLLPPVRDAAPQATGTEISDGAGHWLMEERPKQVVKEINAFFPAG
ncbi:alpha/beta fold hydrolase [Streptomyces sp. NPDC054919]